MFDDLDKLFDSVEETPRYKMKDYRRSKEFQSYREQAARTKREESFDE